VPARRALPPASRPPRRAPSAWFPQALRRLGGEDPASAGRLVLALAPLSGRVWKRDISVDFDIAETGCLAVDIRRAETAVEPRLEPRPVDSVDSILRTDLAGLARVALGRRWPTGAARNDVRGLVRAVARAPWSFDDLLRLPQGLDPRLLFRLLAPTIDPEWTTGHAFTLGFRTQDRARQVGYVHVTDGRPVKVTDAPPLDRVRATLTCDPRQLIELILGELELGGLETRVSGDVGALRHLIEWFARGKVDSAAGRELVEVAG
jgi:hypothetical protein